LIDSILIGTQWFNPTTAIHTATQKAAAGSPAATLSTPAFVCYGYPRIGVLITATSGGSKTSYIYDAAVGVLVKTWQGSLDLQPEAGLTDPLNAIEGQPFYSYLDSLPEAGLAQTSVTIQWQALTDIFSPAVVRRNLGKLFLKEAVPPVPYAIRGLVLPVPLLSQETNVYCAVATAQMALSFLGFHLSQEEIAAAMQTDATGTTNANFIAGVSALTSGKWKGLFTSFPDFATDEQALNSILPEKSGIPQHARLLRGWREYLFLDSQGSVQHTEQFYVVNDPYPVNSGQLVLENVIKPITQFYTNSISFKVTA
jgi:hypothetical protein